MLVCPFSARRVDSFFIENKCVALSFAPDTNFMGKNKQFIQKILLEKYPEKESAIAI